VLQPVAEPLNSESLQRLRSAEFGEMIRARRTEPALDWEEAKRRLDIGE
jgi:hypothetical protein